MKFIILLIILIAILMVLLCMNSSQISRKEEQYDLSYSLRRQQLGDRKRQ
jgi:hypothetical protein